MNILPSTPTSPSSLQRQIGPLFIRLDAQGLAIHRNGEQPIRLNVEEALCVLDFARTAGVRQLANRSWLAEQDQAARDRAARDAAEVDDLGAR